LNGSFRVVAPALLRMKAIKKKLRRFTSPVNPF